MRTEAVAHLHGDLAETGGVADVAPPVMGLAVL